MTSAAPFCNRCVTDFRITLCSYYNHATTWKSVPFKCANGFHGSQFFFCWYELEKLEKCICCPSPIKQMPVLFCCCSTSDTEAGSVWSNQLMHSCYPLWIRGRVKKSSSYVQWEKEALHGSGGSYNRCSLEGQVSPFRKKSWKSGKFNTVSSGSVSSQAKTGTFSLRKCHGPSSLSNSMPY